MFYWIESVQSYNEEGWDYLTELRSFVEGGMSDTSFIDGVSGIVNRGCHNPVSFLYAYLSHSLPDAANGLILFPFTFIPALWHWDIGWWGGEKCQFQESVGGFLRWFPTRSIHPSHKSF